MTAAMKLICSGMAPGTVVTTVITWVLSKTNRLPIRWTVAFRTSAGKLPHVESATK